MPLKKRKKRKTSSKLALKLPGNVYLVERRQNPPKSARRTSFLLDIGLGMLLGLLALSIGRYASASEMEDFVNTKIKEEFIKMDAEQLRANSEMPEPEKNLQAAPEWPRPLHSRDPAIGYQEPAAPGEQAIGMDPRAGLAKRLDPGDPVEQRIAEQQAYKLYRENYRRAVQNEFLRRLHDAGWDTTRNIAEEIKAKEEGRLPVY